MSTGTDFFKPDESYGINPNSHKSINQKTLKLKQGSSNTMDRSLITKSMIQVQ